jgi:riboflavin kinase/FMN adenylyltransferase
LEVRQAEWKSGPARRPEARTEAGRPNDEQKKRSVKVQRWRGLEDVPGDWGRSVVTIGSYDGVHRGHQLIIGRAVQRARGLGLRSVVVTFDPHPSEVVRPGTHPPLLTAHHRRAELLAELGVDAMLILPFTTEFAQLTPTEFVRTVLVDALHARHVVEGPNFRFGHRAAGDVEVLSALGLTYEYEVEVIDLFLRGEDDGEPFSSSLTRRLIAEGDVAGAAEALGRPHRVEGVVVRGAQRGRELGYPTANVEVLPHTAVPADGVYAGWLQVGGEAMPAAISVGTNPTFDGTERSVEAYAIDRVGLDLYGLHVAVDFLAYLRGMEKFDTIEALLARMADDVKRAREIVDAAEPPMV